MITLLELQKQIEKFIAENPEAASLRVIKVNRDGEPESVAGILEPKHLLHSGKVIELS